MLNARVLSCLACPACNLSLVVEEDAVFCSACKRSFFFRDGALRFISGEAEHSSSVQADAFLVRCKNVGKRFPRLYRVLAAVFGTSTGGVSPERFVERYTKPMDLVLNLGSGASERFGAALHVDLFSFAGVDVVADIARLPFCDESVDAVLCIQVLEHVPRPQEVLHEIRRVLKPGGVCYLTTPFLYPYHSSPHDYTRWTLDGLRELADGLEEVQGGLRHGPTSGFVIIFTQWLALVCSFGSVKVFNLLSVVGMAFLAPLAHIPDFFLNRLPMAENIASGHYLIARKSSIV
jgi:Methylase involved in ubiquinone/menaquinone biosynthesis